MKVERKGRGLQTVERGKGFGQGKGGRGFAISRHRTANYRGERFGGVVVCTS